MRCSSRYKTSAFTLIELLVVISIMGLLISILLPSLSKARETTRRTQCASRLRAIFIANSIYVNRDGTFPPLNNMEDDGTWQFNYLIFDGDDFDNNFGPLVRDGIMENIQQLYCPSQRGPFHSLGTQFNPWPEIRGLNTRSGYGRRYHLSGKKLSQIKKTVAFAADVMHTPKVVKSGHKEGVNAVFTDGHAKWVKDFGDLTDNELRKPFNVLDNPIIKDLWHDIDDAP